MNTLNIPTTTGDIDVPVHSEEGCNNLCLTMTEFGSFEITHKHSGRKLYGEFERASSATVELLKIEKCLISIGVDEGLNMCEFQDSIMRSSEEFEELSGMKILEYINFCSMVGDFCNEFPWEPFEESPFFNIERLRKEINGGTRSHE
jgi:hypothetical protein